jgi:hypothetical protein
VNDEKLKDPKDMANAINTCFKTITEKLNVQKIEKGDTISVLKARYLGNFPSIKIIPVTKAETKYNTFPQRKTIRLW